MLCQSTKDFDPMTEEIIKYHLQNYYRPIIENI